MRLTADVIARALRTADVVIYNGVQVSVKGCSGYNDTVHLTYVPVGHRVQQTLEFHKAEVEHAKHTTLLMGAAQAPGILLTDKHGEAHGFTLLHYLPLHEHLTSVKHPLPWCADREVDRWINDANGKMVCIASDDEAADLILKRLGARGIDRKESKR